MPFIRALEQQTETAAHWAEREYDALFAAEAPMRITLVAISDADTSCLIGFVIARCAIAEWEIENVVVAPEHRNHGVGIKIIQELLLGGPIGRSHFCAIGGAGIQIQPPANSMKNLESSQQRTAKRYDYQNPA